MELPSFINYLESKSDKKAINNRRAELMSNIIEYINSERPYKYKSKDKEITVNKILEQKDIKTLAMKVAHLNLPELEWLHINSREIQEKGGNYNWFFFGKIKIKK
jgi:hypothetical protein